MYVAQDIQHVTSKYIPETVTAYVLQGMAINRDGTIHTSTAAGTGFLGLALSDLAPTTAANSQFCSCPESNRMMALATGGRLAIRVAAPAYAALTVGGTFAITGGEAVTGATAKTINGDALIIDAKVKDGTGNGYILVYMN